MLVLEYLQLESMKCFPVYWHHLSLACTRVTSYENRSKSKIKIEDALPDVPRIFILINLLIFNLTCAFHRDLWWIHVWLSAIVFYLPLLKNQSSIYPILFLLKKKLCWLDNCNSSFSFLIFIILNIFSVFFCAFFHHVWVLFRER